MIGIVLAMIIAFFLFLVMTDPSVGGDYDSTAYGVYGFILYGIVALIGFYYLTRKESKAIYSQRNVLGFLVILPAVVLAVAFITIAAIPIIRGLAITFPLMGYYIFLTGQVRAGFLNLEKRTHALMTNVMLLKISLFIGGSVVLELLLPDSKGLGALLIFGLLVGTGLITIAEIVYVLRAHYMTLNDFDKGVEKKDVNVLSDLLSREKDEPAVPVGLTFLLVALLALMSLYPVIKVNSDPDIQILNYDVVADRDTYCILSLKIANFGGKTLEGRLDVIATNGSFNISLGNKDRLAGFSLWKIEETIDYIANGLNGTVMKKLLDHGLRFEVLHDGKEIASKEIFKARCGDFIITTAVFSMAFATIILPKIRRRGRVGKDWDNDFVSGGKDEK